MVEAQARSVQELPPYRGAGFTVNRVAQQWVAQIRQMHADLVSATRFEHETEQGVSLQFLEGLVMGACRSAGGVHGHLLAVARVPRDGSVDGPGFRSDQAHGHGQISFLELAVLQLFGEPLVRLLGLGDHHQAGRVQVQAVDDAGPQLSADPADVRAPGQQGVDQCAVGMARPRVYGQVRRLVHDNQMLVLVDGDKRYVLRNQVRGGPGRRDTYDYRVPGPNPLGGTGDASIDGDHAFGGQGLQAAAGEAGGGQFGELSQPGVQPVPLGLAVNDELVTVAGAGSVSAGPHCLDSLDSRIRSRTPQSEQRAPLGSRTMAPSQMGQAV